MDRFIAEYLFCARYAASASEAPGGYARAIVRWLIVTILCAVSSVELAIAQSPPSNARSSQQYDKPVLSVRVSPPTAYVQQAITQSLTLVSLHPFESLQLSMPEVAGARTVTLVKPRSKPYATYGFEGFMYETVRVLFPVQSGELILPAITVNGSIKRKGADRPEVFSRATEPVILQIAAQPAEFKSDWWLAAEEVTLKEEYSSPLDQMHTGDTVQRIVTLRARGLTGEHLPELHMRNTRNLEPLAGPLLRDTRKTATAVFASVSRTFDLKINEGQIDFAPMAVAWWNTATNTRALAAVPAKLIEPLPRDVEGLVSGLLAQANMVHVKTRNKLIVTGFAVALAAVILAMLLLPALVQRSNPLDRKLERRLRSAVDLHDGVIALRQWCSARYADRPSQSLEYFVHLLDPASNKAPQEYSRSFARISAIIYSTQYTEKLSHSQSQSMLCDLQLLSRQLIDQRGKIDQESAASRKKLHRFVDTLLGPSIGLPSGAALKNRIE